MFEHIRFEMCRRSSLNASGSRWSAWAISGQVCIIFHQCPLVGAGCGLDD